MLCVNDFKICFTCFTVDSDFIAHDSFPQLLVHFIVHFQIRAELGGDASDEQVQICDSNTSDWKRLEFSRSSNIDWFGHCHSIRIFPCRGLSPKDFELQQWKWQWPCSGCSCPGVPIGDATGDEWLDSSTGGTEGRPTHPPPSTRWIGFWRWSYLNWNLGKFIYFEGYYRFVSWGILCYPQIALAIGVLTSNRRGGGHELWRSSRWVPLLGAIAGVPLLGCCWVPLLGCHCWVPLLGCHCVGCHCGVPLPDASYQLWRSSRWVPLLGAIAGVPLLGCCWVPLLGCHCWVPLLGCHCVGCHCGVPLPDASYQLWRSSRWVPLLGAIAGVPLLGCCWVPLLGCHCWVPLLGCHCVGCHCGVPLPDASYQLWRSSRWVPLLGAIAGVPFLGAIERKNWPECYTVLRCAFLYIDNTQIGLCYLGSMLV